MIAGKNNGYQKASLYCTVNGQMAKLYNNRIHFIFSPVV
ncbi:hypothetical protein D1BOALGB6SA_5141 [Olavius sp. associated proteobacterium Delta 1]|nr:hypothetical protein D1BOALGB6SA_5141 [Olavius sp. associated proteobacterium Delta 1]